MKFLAVYTDPKKKTLQRIEIALLIAAAPFALVWGAKSARLWSDYRRAQTMFDAGDVALHAGQTVKAMELFEESVTICPQFYGPWEGLGAIYHLDSDHAKELETYKRAVLALPMSGELHRELGTAYHENGDHSSELKSLTTASEILGADEIFTSRLLLRARKEASGEYPLAAPLKSRNAQQITTTPSRDPGGKNQDPGYGHGRDRHEHSVSH